MAGSTLYIYSTLETLQSVPLAAPANDISFLANGAFAYLAGGTPSGVTVHATCSNAQAATVPTPNTPVFLRSLPSGLQVLGVDSPGIDLINVTSAPVGCSPTVTNTVQSFNLGQGNFVPLQLIMSQDGSQAYHHRQQPGQRSGLQYRQPDFFRHTAGGRRHSGAGFAHLRRNPALRRGAKTD